MSDNLVPMARGSWTVIDVPEAQQTILRLRRARQQLSRVFNVEQLTGARRETFHAELDLEPSPNNERYVTEANALLQTLLETNAPEVERRTQRIDYIIRQLQAQGVEGLDMSEIEQLTTRYEPRWPHHEDHQLTTILIRYVHILQQVLHPEGLHYAGKRPLAFTFEPETAAAARRVAFDGLLHLGTRERHLPTHLQGVQQQAELTSEDVRDTLPFYNSPAPLSGATPDRRGRTSEGGSLRNTIKEKTLAKSKKRKANAKDDSNSDLSSDEVPAKKPKTTKTRGLPDFPPAFPVPSVPSDDDAPPLSHHTRQLPRSRQSTRITLPGTSAHRRPPSDDGNSPATPNAGRTQSAVSTTPNVIVSPPVRGAATTAGHRRAARASITGAADTLLSATGLLMPQLTSPSQQTSSHGPLAGIMPTLISTQGAGQVTSPATPGTSAVSSVATPNPTARPAAITTLLAPATLGAVPSWAQTAPPAAQVNAGNNHIDINAAAHWARNHYMNNLRNVVRDGAHGGHYLLRCHVCGGNMASGSNQYFAGVTGLRKHINNIHRSPYGLQQIDALQTLHRCGHRLNQQQVQAYIAGGDSQEAARYAESRERGKHNIMHEERRQAAEAAGQPEPVFTYGNDGNTPDTYAQAAPATPQSTAATGATATATTPAVPASSAATGAGATTDAAAGDAAAAGTSNDTGTAGDASNAAASTAAVDAEAPEDEPATPTPSTAARGFTAINKSA